MKLENGKWYKDSSGGRFDRLISPKEKNYEDCSSDWVEIEPLVIKLKAKDLSQAEIGDKFRYTCDGDVYSVMTVGVDFVLLRLSGLPAQRRNVLIAMDYDHNNYLLVTRKAPLCITSKISVQQFSV